MVNSNNKKLLGYVVSDKGLVRSKNEDNFLLGHCLNEQSSNHQEAFMCLDTPSWMWAAVFDGMGGEEGGERASLIASQLFQEASFGVDYIARKEISVLAEEVFLKANEAIIDARKESRIGGTTGTLLVANDKEFCVFHKGDSRVYLFRDNDLYILSKDHTLAQLKLDVGIYHSKAEVIEKENHQLTEYIGMNEFGGVSKPYQSEWFEWKDGDKLLICSDGLYDMCSNDDIFANLKNGEGIEDISGSLLQLALKNGGKDNVTILIVERL